jgi:hypothetical protein
VTVAGAALALGTNRRTLLDYKEREEFLPSIDRLLAACEAYTESMLYTPAANGAKFSLANNFKGKHQDWTERHEIDHTTKGQAMPLLGGTTPLPDEDEDELTLSPAMMLTSSGSLTTTTKHFRGR